MDQLFAPWRMAFILGKKKNESSSFQSKRSEPKESNSSSKDQSGRNINRDKLKDGSDACVFCELLQQTDGPENLILFRSAYSFLVLNRYPYNSSHLMAIPQDHCEQLTQLSALGEERFEDLNETLLLGCKLLEVAVKPGGMNIGMNVGIAGGAGIPKHLHYHMVPRWIGDTNFMPVVAGTKVLPENLEDSYHRLKKALNEVK